MPLTPRYRAETLHASLGEEFFDEVEAARFPQHILRFRNQRWADRVGLDALTDAEWIAHFGKFEPLPGAFPKPLALRYHGHQFRSYNPELGDGRGFLFAQLRDVRDERLLDLGTKGSGRTPWSRQGDGRLRSENLTVSRRCGARGDERDEREPHAADVITRRARRSTASTCASSRTRRDRCGRASSGECAPSRAGSGTHWYACRAPVTPPR